MSQSSPVILELTRFHRLHQQILCSMLGTADPLPLRFDEKLYASRFYQLKARHGAIGPFLKPIGAVESAECWRCGNVEQSVMHLYIKRQKWRTERQALKKSLAEMGIRWRKQTEKKWLAELLAKERAVGPIIAYLKDTEWAIEKLRQ